MDGNGVRLQRIPQTCFIRFKHSVMCYYTSNVRGPINMRIKRGERDRARWNEGDKRKMRCRTANTPGRGGHHAPPSWLRPGTAALGLRVVGRDERSMQPPLEAKQLSNNMEAKTVSPNYVNQNRVDVLIFVGSIASRLPAARSVAPRRIMGVPEPLPRARHPSDPAPLPNPPSLEVPRPPKSSTGVFESVLSR
jgi:hypothetical protein